MLKNQNNITELYRQYRLELIRYLCSKFKLDTSESEDIAQMTFVKLSKLTDFHEIDNHKAYLYRVASNQTIDLLRKKDRQKEQYNEPADDDPDDDHLNDPARIHSGRQQLEIMEKAINNMSERRRTFLKMARYENLSNVEIAKRSGVTEASVRKHLANAMLEIKHALSAENCGVEQQ